VAGAVAERVKLSGFLIFSAIYVAVVYPIVGSWGWGGGWLADLNFHEKILCGVLLFCSAYFARL